MKITYTGKQAAISMFVKRKQITLKPDVAVDVTAEQLKDIEQRKYFKSLIDKGLIVIEGGKAPATKVTEPVKKTATKSTKKAEDSK